MSTGNKHKRTPCDAQWCLDNINDLSLKIFCDQLFFARSSKCTLRTSEATGSQSSQSFSKSLTTNIQNLLKSFDTHIESDSPTMTAETTPVSTSATLEPDNNDSNNVNKWTFNNTNVTSLFRQYQQKIAIQVADKIPSQAESDLQELLALSNILFLAPNQHSDLKVQVFGELIDSLCHDAVDRLMDNLDVDFTMQEVSDIAAIVDGVPAGKKLAVDAQMDLLIKARTMDPVKAAVGGQTPYPGSCRHGFLWRN
ncbi:hypothetical protein BDB00DRAFT_881084 [Zychaea mexicana]|uniref:uncharacterized protein n=1 Tax=Zychaea mexicana TaxID=64656 RepID=UPI0022FEE9DD|nr:uncharacterized protein BDB00DRAFT_881084 [Zychaea mexicana]KAI9499032.1 hypothetical protein BDB00DRAFT_881084 [Zychaea mexicana]